ncbi:MAG: oligosaccharide flippase family protein, partial [archaeon]|nr:oligosaccharide flippase family protein [archaeon]
MTRFERVFSVLTFGTMQTVVSKLISFINFAILVRLLSTEEIGIIGLAGGYMALFGILMILPENIIIREFMTIKKNLNVFMNSFLQFSLARGIFLFLIGIPVAIYIQSLQQDPRLSIYFMLLLGVNLINGLNGPFREAFYGFYRQARITFVDIVVNILLLLTMAFLYFHREVLVYGALQVIVALIGVGWWYWNARSHLDFRWMHQWDIGPAVQAMMRFSLWNHLAGVVIRLVYQIDILILGFFVGLATIGDYAVALTLANV